MEDIIVKIEPRHFAAADGYAHTHNAKCPLAQALHEMFPQDESLNIGANMVRVGGKLYTITNWGVRSREGGQISLVGGGTDWPISKIDFTVKDAKVSLEGIPTVSVTLKA